MLIHDDNANPIKSTNALPVSTGYNSDDGFNATVTGSTTTSAQTLRAATSGKSIYITDLIISSSVARQVNLEDSDGTMMMHQISLAANSTLNHSFSSPLKITESKALNYRISKTGGVLTITVCGFVA